MREQQIYARWVGMGTRMAFAFLVLSFTLYALGVLEPLIPPQELARFWSLPVDRYVAETGAPTGWGWLRFLGKGDYLNVLGVAALASVTIVCYARVVPLLPRVQAVLAVIQIAVLLAAAAF